MQLSMSTCSTEREKLPDGQYRFDIHDGLRQCAEAGFSAVDFNFSAIGKLTKVLDGEDWRDWVSSVRDTAQKLNLTFTQTHAHWFYLSDCATAEQLERNEMLVRRSVEATGILGKDIWMVTHPRSVFDAEGFNFQKTLEYNYANFSELGELGRKFGVGIAIENLPPTKNIAYGITTEELVAVMEKLNDSIFGICWDFGHANLSGLDAVSSLSEIAPYLRATHVHDNKRKGDDHFPPFYGNIPWESVMKKLKEIGYTGAFNFEEHASYLAFPRLLRADMLRHMHTTGEYLLSIYENA